LLDFDNARADEEDPNALDNAWERLNAAEKEKRNISRRLKMQNNETEDIRAVKHEELELTDEMIERNDVIDNAVYACILELAEKDEDELPWSMEIIGDVTDAIKASLLMHKIKVRHPGVVTEANGSQHYEN
jgi:hypothetical protein